jgi:hypothetical protein
LRAGSSQRGKEVKRKAKGAGRMQPVLHPEAAGVDMGGEEIFVAVLKESVCVRSVGPSHVN